MLFATLLTLVAVSLPLALLTALGARQRGLATPLAVLTGLVYPVSWTVWYVKDEHPYRRDHQHTA